MDLQNQVLRALSSQDLPTPSKRWLANLITARNPPPPAASLAATARARLLASDLTTPGLLDPAYAAAHALPVSANREVASTRLGRKVVVQVLDVENLSRSRWEQVEELEAIERGEQTRGREVVRLRDAEDDNQEQIEGQEGGRPQAHGTQAGRNIASDREAADRKATHRLVLQDAKGQKVFALELRRIEKIGVGRTNIGEKILLKESTTLARGVALLHPAHCVVLGGKVDSWQKAWTDRRLARLRESVGADRDRRDR